MTYGEMIDEIERYIRQVKNVKVVINLPRNIGEIRKMQKMYLIANEYFNNLIENDK